MRSKARDRWWASAPVLLAGANLLILLLAGERAFGAVDPAADLAGTGLYSDFPARTIDPRNLSYAPQYPLWSDGAQKRRWIYLPPYTSIDASNPDAWVLPVGTKVWKEFSFGGRRVETRLMEALDDGVWRFASYAWDAQESGAALVPENGLRGVVEIRPGKRHDIPGVGDCRICHGGLTSEVLGFSALQLSPDRDPNAANAEPVSPDMVNLETLMERGLIRSHPRAWAEKPPRIAAQKPAERAAVGYFHGNCGNCHNRTSTLEPLGLLLRHTVADSNGEEPALKTTVNRTGTYQIPGVAPDSTYLLRPGDPAHSSILYRMATRNPFRQMPPLGTKIVDEAAVNLVRRWIQEDLVGEDSRLSGRGR